MGLNHSEVSYFPVGYERQVEMHSLDFEEFLWAREIQEDLISDLSEYFKNASPVENFVNKKNGIFGAGIHGHRWNTCCSEQLYLKQQL